MKRALVVGGAIAAVLVLLVLLVYLAWAAVSRSPEEASHPGQATPPAAAPSPEVASGGAEEEAAHHGFLYGRVTTFDGATYEGRLRFGGDEEAFWGHYFNGSKAENPWAAHVPPERLTERRPIEILGVEIAQREREIDLARPFMARFGDIARIDARGRNVRVTLKSGTVFDLDGFEAGDFDDGVRVWDGARGVVDLVGEPVEARMREALGQDPESRRIRTIELLPATGPAAGSIGAPDRLHGTVRTGQGDFTGFVQWDREECVGSDELVGHTADGELALRFDTLRSIERRSSESSRVTLVDGREIVLSGTRKVGEGNRGVYVDDPRYGRLLVSWAAFERLDLSPGPGGGPAYGDFPPGRPLTGSVTTRAGRRLTGRLVYDLDESETTETLDAPSRGVSYTLPFGLVTAIVPPGRGEGGARHATVTLHGGEELELEAAGDLGEGNAGLLVFVDGRDRPEYVPWEDVGRIDLDRPPAMYPPLDLSPTAPAAGT